MRRLFSCALLLTSLSGQPPATRDLFPEPPVCRLPAKEVRVGRAIFQVFPDAKSGKELFRIRIGGLYGKEWLKWWTYGVQNCGDFNRDGVLDYTWYGGDDTSLGHYLILSSPAGHRIIDIEKTFQQAWTRQYAGKAPAIGPGCSTWRTPLRMQRLRWCCSPCTGEPLFHPRPARSATTRNR